MCIQVSIYDYNWIVLLEFRPSHALFINAFLAGAVWLIAGCGAAPTSWFVSRKQRETSPARSTGRTESLEHAGGSHYWASKSGI